MPKIEKMFAFIATDKDGNDEGVISFFSSATRTWMPLVAADIARVDSLKEMAQDIADNSGKSVKLISFETRTEIETLTPKKGVNPLDN